ncbi:MAG: asparagine synthase (glutamine-hydrolyzing) [Oligoflexia bacterium]|nr:asparagine synthase (glutamine-hydrolyzing) [Oligoflexia bacterium]
MCGIAGFRLREGEAAEPGALERMAQAMRRRGPDAQGTFTDGPVGLAHRRLSIIDLTESAQQPLFNEDGRLAVVFNGEVYNFTVLREELERAGHRFRTRSDTEVIVHAFEEWGLGMLARFNGIFAIALWDGREGRRALYLLRDRFGVKPLFYAYEEGRLSFASELKPLLTLPWISREPDLESVYHFLKFSHVPTPRSILRGVRQLPPGSWLRLDEEGLEQGRFAPSVGEGKPAAPTLDNEEEALAALDRALGQSVRRQLVAEVPVGCFLSGGVDSSLLTAAYAEAAPPGAARTFSIGYREREFDESGHARRVAEAFGTTHHELIVGPRDYIDLIPEAPDYFDQPFADPTLLSSLLLAKFTRREVTVALSGDGGDELFFGYPYQRALLHLDRLRGFPAGPRRAIAASAGRTLEWLGALGLRGRRLQQGRKLADILSYQNEAELLQSFIGTVGPLPLERLARLIAGEQGSEAFSRGPCHAELIGSLRGLQAPEKVTRLFLETFLVDTVLAKTDRATMAYGLEARVPFLDEELVAFAETLPFRWKLREGTSKYLPRRLLARKLHERGAPTDLAWRPKQGFSIPLRDWLRGELRYLLDEYLDPRRLEREGIFAAPEVRTLVREHLQGSANHSHLLWSLISFRMWKERHLP